MKNFCIYFLIIATLVGCASTTDNPNNNSSSKATLYKGEWLWLAEFVNSGIQYSGYLSISEKLDDTNNIKNSEGGIWRWCTSTCNSVSGVGFLADMRTNTDPTLFLTTAFYDGSIIKMLAIDRDNRIGYEVDNSPTILGGGLWYFTAGGNSTVAFGMVKIANNPVYSTGSVMRGLDNFSLEPTIIQSQNSEDLNIEDKLYNLKLKLGH